MPTATLSLATTRRRVFPEPVETPARLPSKLHDVLWYVEMAMQRMGFAPWIDEICQVFGVSRTTAAEMILLLSDKGLVYLCRDGQPLVWDLTESGHLYCQAYAPA